MELDILRCTVDDDVDILKCLTDYPDFFQIEDFSGLTILQRAISNESFAVFDFLLSMDDCPINAYNSRGITAIQFALANCCNIRWVKNFIYPLLKKGANVDLKNSKESPALRLALYDDRFDIAQCLIEKGWDLNYQDSDTGRTPLHMIRDLHRNQNELLAMMLYFDGDPSIRDFNGFTPIDYAFQDGYLSESMLEHLMFYIFDDYCTEYEIPINGLFGLMQLESPLLPQILKHITSVNLDINYILDIQNFLQKLFIMKPENLKLLLEKFDYVIETILDAFLGCQFTNYVLGQEVSIENCKLLLQSQFSSDVIQIISKIQINSLIGQPETSKRPHSEIFDLIFFLLSYGANIYDSDLELIYEKFGDCEFFRMLLHMDIKINELRRFKNGIMPALLYDIHMDIETFLNDRNQYAFSANELSQLLNYFADPKQQDFCWWTINFREIRAKMKDLPSVPLLVELARNETRKFLIQKYKIKNSMQFYTLIKHLPISKVHQKIITLETKLY